MGTHSFNAINIKNYTLVSPASQSVSLTSSNPNQSITFKYKKTSGKVNIKYIDKPAQIEIATEDVIENLSMGSYTYNAKTVDGYSVLGDYSKTVTLTEESPNASITFEYDIVYLPLDISKQNEVPYISTYYIKPVVEPGEEVFIDYYITDYYYKEYLEEDYSENFTVTVRIEGQADKVFRNMKAAEMGTRLHEWAAETIKLGIKQPRSNKTLCSYVNDAIGFKMDTEVVLFYSERFFRHCRCYFF